jgi:two-component system, chemotaxis family, chemotaxis protein CheY
LSGKSQAPAKRLLAVDDNADSAELVERLAAKCGYDARSLTDPRALRAVLQDWKPEVITLDLCMPEEDGIGTFATLQEFGFRGELVIISGQADWLRKSASRLASARGLRVAADLSKPVDLSVLRSLLTKFQTERAA